VKLMSSFPDGRHETQQQLREQARLGPGETGADRQTVLLATTDPEIRGTIIDLLRNHPIDVLCASQMEEIKLALAKRDVVACFCGFWLVDGTYRDVVRHLKSQRTEVPVIILCAPTCPEEYRDYLAALNIRAFNFICYPYRRSDVESALHAATLSRNQAFQLRAASAPQSPDGSLDSPGLRRAS
jgi:DNA-binding NtrC family response regulator